MELEEFTLTIRTGNAAFGSDQVNTELELARMLREIADRISCGDYYPGHTRTIMDVNGNRVGGFRWGDERD